LQSCGPEASIRTKRKKDAEASSLNVDLTIRISNFFFTPSYFNETNYLVKEALLDEK
jgi:hypothetical protein